MQIGKLASGRDNTQFTPHFETGQNCKKTKHVQFRNFQSPTVQLHSRRRQDEARQSSLFCVGGVNWALETDRETDRRPDRQTKLSCTRFCNGSASSEAWLDASSERKQLTYRTSPSTLHQCHSRPSTRPRSPSRHTENLIKIVAQHQFYYGKISQVRCKNTL